MEKIVRVLRRICNNSERILEPMKFGNELYFKYLGHSFSVLRRFDGESRLGEYSFYVYPNWNGKLDTLAQLQEHGAFEETGGQMISYDSSNVASDEIAHLYRLVETKVYNVDKIFDDILADDL